MRISKPERQRAFWTLLFAVIFAGLAIIILSDTPASAAEGDQSLAAAAAAYQDGDEMEAFVPPSDEACRLCHADTEAVISFPSGDSLSAHVDLGILSNSAHGTLPDDPLSCTSCHAAAEYQFPHPPPEAGSLREYEILQSQSCERCHQQAHITSHPGPESENPVICTDCHGSHDVLTAGAWQAGEGIGMCVDCHTEREVEPVDPAFLTQVVQNDLFREQVDNDYCLACHSQIDFFYNFDNGERLSLTINEEDFHDSVHGLENPWQPLECVNCHEGYRFPHEPIIAETLREYELEKYELCASCHEPKYEAHADSVHGVAQSEGVEQAAVCTDCHGAHYTPDPDESPTRNSLTCGQCHGTIFREYADSVHGEAVLEEGNADVATCTDCHGVHMITDPNLAAFRNSSPELCGECHADEELMEEYDISTEVFDTYVADFHGTTVTLFDIQDPTVETNKAVCFDCHGVHDIRRPDDPRSGIKENLLETCRKCHPDATENFPDSWTSHYQPSLEHQPFVFLVEWFYRLVIPATVGFLGFIVGTDVYRRVREWVTKE